MATATTNKAPSLEDALRAAKAIAVPGVSRVLLYGSVARGDQNQNSDIDLVAIYDDLDYENRGDTQDELRDLAREASGFNCDVYPTDFPEWQMRQTVSSSFEKHISGEAVCLVKKTPQKINWEKKMIKAASNEEEVRKRLDTEITDALSDITIHCTTQMEAEFLSDYPAEEKERHRLARMRRICAASSMLIEQSLKTIIVLQGEYPITEKELKGLGHDINVALEQITPEFSNAFASGINAVGLKPREISSWREKATYPDDVDTLNARADRQVEYQVSLSLGIASTMLAEIERQIGMVGESQSLRRILENTIRIFTSTDIRICTPLAEPREFQNPVPPVGFPL